MGRSPTLIWLDDLVHNFSGTLDDVTYNFTCNPVSHVEVTIVLRTLASTSRRTINVRRTGLRVYRCWKLHPLKGDQKGHWSVWVSGNWRLTFMFEGEDAVLVDYQDYH